MQEITTKEMINHLKNSLIWKTTDFRETIGKAIIAKLEEAKQREGNCRWTQDEYHQWSGCGNSFHKLDDCSDKFVYCPYCKKEIEWEVGEMSDRVKRYKGEYLSTILGFLINNSWCESSDVKALERENEELRKQLDNTIKNWDEEDIKQTDYGIKLETELEDIKKENEELKKKVKILKRVLGLAETKRKSEYEYKV